MKNLKILIILTFLVSISVISQAQDKVYKLADETVLTELKTSFKIDTSNEVILQKILIKFRDVITRYTVNIRTDRAGRYLEYSIPFKKDKMRDVVVYIQSL